MENLLVQPERKFIFDKVFPIKFLVYFLHFYFTPMQNLAALTKKTPDNFSYISHHFGTFLTGLPTEVLFQKEQLY